MLFSPNKRNRIASFDEAITLTPPTGREYSLPLILKRSIWVKYSKLKTQDIFTQRDTRIKYKK